MIVRDEAAMLEDCLRSARAAVDEIVVVDTGSSDDSRDIARAFGAVVADVAWQGDFAEARNRSLSLAHGTWVLQLDADERLEADAQAFRTWLRATKALACQVPIRNILGEGREERHSAVRLFRRLPGARYERRLHEQVIGSLLALRPQGRIVPAPIRIVHLGYQAGVVEAKGKRERNLALALAEVRQHPEDPFAAYTLGVEYLATGRRAEGVAELRRARSLAPVVDNWQSRLFKLETAALLLDGRSEEALACAQAGLRHFPRFSDLHYLAGALLADLGRLRQAERELRRAAALGPAETPPFDGADPRLGGAEAWRALAGVLARQHRLGEAEAAARKALLLEPRELGHVQALVEYHAAQGREPRELWESPPPSPLEAAAALYRLGRHRDALAAFAAARATEPVAAGRLRLLEGLCLVHLSEAAPALRALATAIEAGMDKRHGALDDLAWAVGLRSTDELRAADGSLPASIERLLGALGSHGTVGDAGHDTLRLDQPAEVLPTRPTVSEPGPRLARSAGRT